MKELLGLNEGILFIVATPIGNLEDITLRALRVLKEVDIISCEDTRVTQRLLKHYDISNQLFSWHANSSLSSLEKIISWLQEGKTIAYVSDAGTPGVSDPGMLLVKKVRQVLPQVLVRSVPGPSALTAAISIGGVSMSQFVWLGFLPHKKGREKLLIEAIESKRPAIFFESPHRLEKFLQQVLKLEKTTGIHKEITICRELTKIHETIVTSDVATHLRNIKSDKYYQKGEFVIIMH